MLHHSDLWTECIQIFKARLVSTEAAKPALPTPSRQMTNAWAKVLQLRKHMKDQHDNDKAGHLAAALVVGGDDASLPSSSTATVPALSNTVPPPPLPPLRRGLSLRRSESSQFHGPYRYCELFLWSLPSARSRTPPLTSTRSMVLLTLFTQLLVDCTVVPVR